MFKTNRAFVLMLAMLCVIKLPTLAADLPNILWISNEDISAHFGCYGDEHAHTPNLDRLATQGVRYTHAYGHAGVCAVNRSGIITGMYPTTLGSQHMRNKAILPDAIKPFPLYLRQAGYYTTNQSKTDYNFSAPKETWDDSSSTAHWRNRKPGQPFFAVFNATGTHESAITSEDKHLYGSTKSESKFKPNNYPNYGTTRLSKSEKANAAQLILPPYYPDTPIVREDWKRNYDNIAAFDKTVGDILRDLEEAGLADDTIVIYWSDHGVGLPRAKRWLYDSGIHVPFIVRIPEKFRVDHQGLPNTVNPDLVAFIDLAPTMLNLAGIKIPGHMQGQPFLGNNRPALRTYVYGARDRMDERYDIIRYVRDHQYKYIRNYSWDKPYYQYMNTPEKGATMQELRRLHATGSLPPAAELFMADSKPLEELFDTYADPYEINNLAADPKYAKILATMREESANWAAQTGDLGLMPEPEINLRAEAIGSGYEILRKSNDKTLSDRLVAAARLGEKGQSGVPAMLKALKDKDAAVRYWGAYNLGNLGSTALSQSKNALNKALTDASPSVRIVAARALCLMKQPKKAVGVLRKEIAHERSWVRLAATLVLDEIGESARPSVKELENARGDKENKYVARVATHALNGLLGTNYIAK